jgi:hypothetical protein
MTEIHSAFAPYCVQTPLWTWNAIQLKCAAWSSSASAHGPGKLPRLSTKTPAPSNGFAVFAVTVPACAAPTPASAA